MLEEYLERYSNVYKQLLSMANKNVDIHTFGYTEAEMEYDEENQPKRVDTVVISTQHDDAIDNETLRRDVMEKVIKHIIPSELLDDETKYYINPTGRFVIGGPQGDAGLTGRKIIVDTYGGYERHGGGVFSGKDATKVDRSASYAARYKE